MITEITKHPSMKTQTKNQFQKTHTLTREIKINFQKVLFNHGKKLD